MNGDRTLVTGFLGFGRFAVNPSAILAERCGRKFELIEVAFSTADALVERLADRPFDRLMLMGVAGTSSGFRLETQAMNRVGRAPDTRGVIAESDAIDPAALPILRGTLWSPSVIAQLTTDARIMRSDDAGDYLCNYLYFRALSRLPGRAIGFLHVPPVEAISIDAQVLVLNHVLAAIEGKSF